MCAKVNYVLVEMSVIASAAEGMDLGHNNVVYVTLLWSSRLGYSKLKLMYYSLLKSFESNVIQA